MASLFLKPDLAQLFLYFYLYVLKLFPFNVKLIFWSCSDSLIISLTSFLLITSVVKETLYFLTSANKVDCQGEGDLLLQYDH